MLDEAGLDPDPFVQFRRWYGEALGAGVPDADSMVLATATPDGQPSARTVLLKGVDERGFSFFTNHGSAKARDLAANPRAAAVFLWRPVGRQVRAAGRVERLSDGESDAYFATRPRGSRISAWASRQSEVIPDRSYLQARVAEVEARYAGQEVVPRPPFWGGYVLVPDAVELWEHRDDRLHDRLRYRRPAPGHAWLLERLSP